MRCAKARALLPELAGGELAGASADEVRRHVRGCPECADRLAELAQTVELCRNAGTEPLPEGFGLELRRRLAQAGTPRRAPLWSRLFARPMARVGAAAALAAILAASGTAAILRRPKPPAAMAQVPASKVALVKVDFVAAKAVEDVRFEVLLPDGLRFFSEGHMLTVRSFQWRGRLEQGSNPIPIAVKGPRAGRFHLIAHAVGPGLDVTQNVILEVTA